MWDTDVFQSYLNSIPVGIDVHVVLLLPFSDGSFRYAIKSEIIEEDHEFVFSESDLIIATEEEVIEIINELP